MAEQFSQRVRWLLTVTAACTATIAAMAVCIGLLDRGVADSDVGRAILSRGAIVLAAATALGILAWPHRWKGWRRLLVLAIGIWPFATFGLFIVWRGGVADEQLAACEEGDAGQCRDLALRRERRHRDAEALVLFERSCALGDARSCVTFAARLRGTARDNEVDVLLAGACEGDVAIACTSLARRQLETDRAGALDLLAQGCELGDANACAERALLVDQPAR